LLHYARRCHQRQQWWAKMYFLFFYFIFNLKIYFLGQQ
jgi:hypothetical protein